MAKYRQLAVGDAAPWFRQRATTNPSYAFDTVGGRYVVLCLHGSAADPAGRSMLQLAAIYRTLFDDDTIAFFSVSVDPSDEAERRVGESLPGIRAFLDHDGAVSRLYGAMTIDDDRSARYRRMWIVLDPTLRVRAIFDPAAGATVDTVGGYLTRLPPVDLHAGFPVQAPVLILPRVFDPDFCRQLIDLYDADGGSVSGFMREVDGKTVPTHDAGHKVRSDFLVEDEALKARIRRHIERAIVPEVRKVHQFPVTRIERYLVGCYDSASGGHFRAHRDNTTKGTAHRRFAVSINLNDDFEGGEVSFPEYGRRGFKVAAGGAVVFSCSLLHMVTPVRSGRRYAFLPFLYDDAAARLREENLGFIVPDTAAAPSG